MIFAILLSTLSLQVTAVTFLCPDSLRVLAATNDIETTIIEAYTELLKNIPVEDLRDLQISPLKLPKNRVLQNISGYRKVLEALIDLIHTRFETDTQIQLKLKTLIDIEISKRLAQDASIKAEVSKTKVLNFDQSIDFGKNEVDQIALSRDQKIIYIRSTDARLRFLDANTLKPLTAFSGNQIKVESFSQSLDGRLIYTFHPSASDSISSIRIWDAKTGLELPDETAPQTLIEYPRTSVGIKDTVMKYMGRYRNWVIDDFKLSPDGQSIFTRQYKGIYLANPITGEIEPKPLPIEDRENSFSKFSGFVFHPKKNLLYARNPVAQEISIFDLKKGEIEKIGSIAARGSQLTPLPMFFSPNGKILFVAKNDEIIPYNTLTNGPLTPNIKFVSKRGFDEFISLATSADGLRLYAGGKYGGIYSWYLPDYFESEYFEDTP